MEKVPFLFVSDNDPAALTIFTTLKYGSLANAFASPIMVCPRLRWVGVKSEHIGLVWKDSVEARSEATINLRPNASAAEIASIKERDEQYFTRALEKLRTGRNNQFKKGDNLYLAALIKHNLLEDDLEASEELARMDRERTVSTNYCWSFIPTDFAAFCHGRVEQDGSLGHLQHGERSGRCCSRRGCQLCPRPSCRVC